MIETVSPVPEDQNLFEVELEQLVRRNSALLEGLLNKRIFLTGGTGFIGCNLLEILPAARTYLDIECELTVLTRDPEGFRRKAPYLVQGLRLVKGDQTSFSLPGERYDLLIHAAVEYGQPLETLDRNLRGTQRILEFAGNSKVDRMLFTSSGAVYGPQPVDITHLTEEHGVNAPWLVASGAYAEAKRVSELPGCLCGERYGFTFVPVRGFAFVGPYLPLHGKSAIGNFIGNAIEGSDIYIAGDGTTQRSYLYGPDLAIWLWTLLFKGKHGQPYNVGSSEAISFECLARRVRDLLAPEKQVHIAMQPDNGQSSARYVPSVRRAKDEFGLEDRVG